MAASIIEPNAGGTHQSVMTNRTLDVQGVQKVGDGYSSVEQQVRSDWLFPHHMALCIRARVFSLGFPRSWAAGDTKIHLTT